MDSEVQSKCEVVRLEWICGRPCALSRIAGRWVLRPLPSPVRLPLRPGGAVVVVLLREG